MVDTLRAVNVHINPKHSQVCQGAAAQQLDALLFQFAKVLATDRCLKSLAHLSERYGDQVRLIAMDETDEAAAANAVMVAVDVFGSLAVRQSGQLQPSWE